MISRCGRFEKDYPKAIYANALFNTAATTAKTIHYLCRTDRQIKIGSTAGASRTGNFEKISYAGIFWLKISGVGCWYSMNFGGIPT